MRTSQRTHPVIERLATRTGRVLALAGVLLTPVLAPGLAQAADDRQDDAASERSGSPGPKSERTLVKHRVVPYESVDSIATRYGVTRAELERWNKVLKGGQLKAGWTLKVMARVVPPPRQKISYEVQFGDTWQKIAQRFHVPEGDLHRWNRKVPRQFKAGQALVVYTDPKPRRVSAVASVEPGKAGTLGQLPGEGTLTLPEFDVPQGGLSVGRPNRGKLVNGVALPESDLYTVRRPEEAFGSSHTILKLQQTISAFRQSSGYDGKIVIGAISLEHGGRFRPHHSHQSGRDIDIRLPKKAGASLKSESPNDIDWAASWVLIQSFIEHGDATYIFLDYSRQKRLYEAAKAAGASSAELDKALQYPRPRNTNNGVVRHEEGHLIHVHVRVKCPENQVRCED
ncbi:MAG: penicillin-insensitive murein endopeptidase [Deltaproteobacteria bacterium]|nr:penicillin-insensitive murein endopeptidase [Deltaproteobacteria bacterium]MBK8715802.1 penicillin-insensitive murein endopeptidase [Deltaproteobacteria bacterium]MBP7288119.1 penicillin-insensitive murein endopeptidase [Nannocystaceae bacterium]